MPTILVMLIVGLCHGANWTFVVFGGMHGVFLVVNHIWRKRKFLIKPRNSKASPLSLLVSWALTFLCIMTAMVMFRSDSVTTAIEIYKGMLGLNGFNLIVGLNSFIGLRILFLVLILALLIVLIMPSVPSLLSKVEKNTRTKIKITSPITGIILGIIFMLSIISMDNKSPFLYFQF